MYPAAATNAEKEAPGPQVNWGTANATFQLLPSPGKIPTGAG